MTLSTLLYVCLKWDLTIFIRLIPMVLEKLLFGDSGLGWAHIPVECCRMRPQYSWRPTNNNLSGPYTFFEALQIFSLLFEFGHCAGQSYTTIYFAFFASYFTCVGVVRSLLGVAFDCTHLQNSTVKASVLSLSYTCVRCAHHHHLWLSSSFMIIIVIYYHHHLLFLSASIIIIIIYHIYNSSPSSKVVSWVCLGFCFW